MELPSGECHKTSLVLSQYYFRLWLGVVRHWSHFTIPQCQYMLQIYAYRSHESTWDKQHNPKKQAKRIRWYINGIGCIPIPFECNIMFSIPLWWVFIYFPSFVWRHAMGLIHLITNINGGMSFHWRVLSAPLLPSKWFQFTLSTTTDS